jgi:hypothetical protein
MAWTQDDVEFFKSNLSGLIPHMKVDMPSTFGGSDIFFLLCFDARETWSNKIMENSRYTRIMLQDTGKVEHFSGSCGIKMRGFTSTDRSKILAKIQAHIAKVKELAAQPVTV